MAHPTTMIGTDGFPQREGKPHPRTYGTYPRVLQHYVRTLGLLSLEQAVHKMTGMTARNFRIAERGLLRAGACADVVVFDPARIADTATYDDPVRASVGIVAVYVNGRRAYAQDGGAVEAREGRLLRRAAPPSSPRG
jgi:N-acyl-D-amino-acid deacylase